MSNKFLVNGDKMIKTREVMNLLGVSRNTLKKYIRAGIIPPPLHIEKNFHLFSNNGIQSVLKKMKSGNEPESINDSKFLDCSSDEVEILDDICGCPIQDEIPT